MKKKALSRNLIFTALFVLAISIPCAHAQDIDPPTIVHIEGHVSANLTGEWIPAKEGMHLDENSIVKTHKDSYCDVALDESVKNIISLGPDTEVVIGKYLQRIKISMGSVFAQMDNLEPGSEFEVETPSAIAGVRGTGWQTDVAAETTQIKVNENTVYVQGLDEKGDVTGEVDVTEGQKVAVGAEGWIGDLALLTEQDKKQMEEWSARLKDLHLKLQKDKENCAQFIDGYNGASSNLFAQVLSCEAQGEDSFASAPTSGDFNVAQNNQFSDPGLGDITNNTFNRPLDIPPEIPPPGCALSATGC